jgi:N-acetylmuramoyl-L-alanine amidase
MQTAFARYGYGVTATGRYDGTTMEVVTAFQRHFRPAKIDGICDHSTMSTLHALLSSLPGEAVKNAAT